MGLIQGRKTERNAAKARNSFVTRRVENKLSFLAETYQNSAGRCCTGIECGTLSRKLNLEGFQYLSNLKLVYNWENRFLSVNYNLEMLSDISTNEKFTEIGDCEFALDFGIKSTKWVCKRWLNEDFSGRSAYIERLSNPMIMDRIKELDVVGLQITHQRDSGYFQISCESMIGSATWILIPPITNLINPRMEECVKFFELFELLGDAVINNN